MIKVGVLMGGMSIEREVSFNSGRTICDHLDSSLFSIIPIFQTAQGDLYKLPWIFLYRGKISDFEHRLEQQAEKISWDQLPLMIDFMYIATHGQYAEDGRLQGMLELFNIPYLGSKRMAAALGMNKRIHNQFLQAQGVRVPRSFALSVAQVTASSKESLQQLLNENNLTFPLIIKPSSEGSSFGVFAVNDLDALYQGVQASCFISSEQGQEILVEEKIVGMEFTCICLTDLVTGDIFALPPTEVIVDPKKQIFDYEQKYMPGAVNERTPAHCAPEFLEKIKKSCIRVMHVLGFTNLARIDGFVTAQGDVVIIDSNPLSGMGPTTFLFRQAAEINMSHTQLINHLIKTELAQFRGAVVQEKKQSMKKLRIGVLMGGPSNEKETSLNSGRNVAYKLAPDKYEGVPLFVDDAMQLFQLDNRLLVHTSTREIQENIAQATPVLWSDLPKLVDFVFIGLHGGKGEDGTVQGALEILKMPYNGSGVFASALCMDKYKTGQFLRHEGFATPDAWLVDKLLWQADQQAVLVQLEEQFRFPCIIKPHDDGCSVMVYKVESAEQAVTALTEIFAQKSYALVEELLIGMELTVGVMGNDVAHALVPSQSVAKKGILTSEEKFLPGAGENQTPALLPLDDIDFVRRELERVYEAIGCKGYVRIDCFFQTALQSRTGARRLVILEINSLPALTPATCLFAQAAEEGMRPMEFLDKVIQLGLELHTHPQTISVDVALEKQQKMY